MFDLDGTLILSNRKLGSYRVIPGAVEVLTELERRGLPYLALTNGSAYPAAKQGPRLREVGLPIVDGHLFTPNSVAGKVFKERGYQNVLVLGTPGVVEALNGHGIRCSLPGDEAAKTRRRGLFRLASRVLDGRHPRRRRPRARRCAVLHRLGRAVLRHQRRAGVRLFLRDQRRDPPRDRGGAASDWQAEPTGDGLRRRQARPAAGRDRGDRRRSQGRDRDGGRRRRDRRRRDQRHDQRASNGPRSLRSGGPTL